MRSAQAPCKYTTRPMPKSFSLFLALRYLKPKRTFLSIITLVSILGVTLGIMVLILVISVMTGFEQELRRKDKALAEAAALLIASKKIQAFWGEAEED